MESDEVSVVDLSVIDDDSLILASITFYSTRYILFIRRVQGLWTITRTLVFDEGFDSPTSLSTDGEWLAVATGWGEGPYIVTPHLWLVPLDDVNSRYDLSQDLTEPVLDVLHGLAFSPNSDLLVTGEGDEFWLTYFWPVTGRVRIWDVETRQLLITLDNHTRPVQDVAFSPDGTLIASASRDGTVRLWGIATD